jgi:hypothetical protein
MVHDISAVEGETSNRSVSSEGSGTAATVSTEDGVWRAFVAEDMREYLEAMVTGDHRERGIFIDSQLRDILEAVISVGDIVCRPNSTIQVLALLTRIVRTGRRRCSRRIHDPAARGNPGREGKGVWTGRSDR